MLYFTTSNNITLPRAYFDATPSHNIKCEQILKSVHDDVTPVRENHSMERSIENIQPKTASQTKHCGESFSISTCNVSLTLGKVCLLSSMGSKVGKVKQLRCGHSRERWYFHHSRQRPLYLVQFTHYIIIFF